MDEQHKPEPDNRNDTRRPGNPNAAFTFRILGAGVVLYWLYQLVESFIKGGPDAPSVGLLILAIVVLGGGSIFVAVLAFKLRRQDQEAEEAARQEEALPAEEDEPEEPEV